MRHFRVLLVILFVSQQAMGFSFNKINDVSCGSGVYINKDSKALVSGDAILFSARDAYTSSYDMKVYSYLLNTTALTCTALSYPVYTLPTHGRATSDLDRTILYDSGACDDHWFTSPDSIVIDSGGYDIWNDRDDAVYVNKEVKGSGMITAINSAFDTKGNYWAKSGPMVRNSLDARSSHMSTLLGESAASTIIEVRSVYSASTSWIATISGGIGAYYLRLINHDDEQTAWYSTDAITWTLWYTASIEMTGSTYFLGIGQSAQDYSSCVRGTWDKIQIDGYVVGDEFTNYFLPITADYTIYPFLLVSGQGKLLKMKSDYSEWEDHKVWDTSFQKAVHSAFTYTSIGTAKCAWYFVDYNGWVYTVLESNVFTSNTFGTISSNDLGSEASLVGAAVDSVNVRAFLAMEDNSLVIIDISEFMSTFGWQTYTIENFFIIPNYILGMINLESTLLVHYGPIAIGYDFELADPTQNAPVDMFFGTSGEPTMLHVDNKWRGLTPGDAPAGVFMAQKAVDVTIQMSVSDQISSAASFNEVFMEEKLLLLNSTSSYENVGFSISLDYVPDLPAGYALGEVSVVEYSVFNCSVHTTCEEAIQDDLYCGWCLTGHAVQAFNEPCTGEALYRYSQRSGCPTFTSITPTNIPSGNAVNITIKGILYADEIPALSCFVAGSTVVGFNKSESQMTCEIPSLSVGSHYINLHYNSSNYTTDAVSISVFDCADQKSCSECTSVVGCGWEYDAIICRNIQTISSAYASIDTECPAVAGVSPSGATGGTGGFVNVTVSPMYPPEEGSINCTFIEEGGVDLHNTTGTYINSTLVNCKLPIVTLGGSDVTYRVYITFTNTTRFYAETYASFLFYTCSNSFTCAECVDPLVKQGCVWCYENAQCMTEGTGCPAQYTASGSCPSILATAPDASYYSEATDVTLKGLGMPEDYYNYTASVNMTGDSTFFAAEWQNSTSILVQDVSMTVSGIANISVYLNNSFVALFEDYVLYECTQYTDCSTCTGGYSRCGWCYDTGCVHVDSSCPSGMFEEKCPRLLSIEPQRGHMELETAVVLTGSYFPVNFTYYLRVVETIVPYEKNGSLCTYVSNTTLNCSIPASGYQSEASVYLVINDTLFTDNSSLVFDYYRCSEYSSCEECVEQSACSYCHFGTCVETTAISTDCDNGTHVSTCPALSSTTPDTLNVGGGVNVTMNGTFGLPVGYDYAMAVLCRIGSSYFSGEVLSNNSIACYNVPKLAGNFTSAPYFVNVTLHVSINLIALLETNLTYFDCGATELQTDCATCLDRDKSLPKCGYCFGDWKCSEASECSVPASYLTSTCPAFQSSSISYAASTKQIEVTYTGTHLPTYTGNVFCNYTVNATKATVDSSNSLRCLSPLSMGQNSMVTSQTVLLSVDGRQYSPDTLSFETLNCAYGYIESTACTYCSVKEARCGWCSNISNSTYACTTQYGCTADLWASSSTSCPAVSGLSSSIFYVSGGGLILFTGTMLFETTELRCVFESTVSTEKKETVATALNSTHGSCPVPPWTLNQADTPESLTFTILYDNRSFAEGFSSTLTMIPVPKDVGGGGINPLLLAGGGISTFVIILIMIIIMIIIVIIFVIIILTLVRVYMTKGKRKLKKPNFNDVCFKADDKVKYTLGSKETRVLRYMEDIILEYEDTDFLNEVIDHILPEEVDQFCKNLIYILLPLGNSKVISVITAFFNLELQKSQNEQTLFRVNSITTKMFAKYARIVGCDFLWTALAYFIDDICFKYAGEKKEDDIGMKEISMEIDPTKVEEEDIDFLAANTYQLLLTLTNLFRRFTRLSHQFPPQLGFFLGIVFEEVREKYPGAEYKSVGGFLFLRWVCPAIFSPHVFGVSAKPPSQEANRMLVLIAKTVQNISNETYPGRKEDFMGKVDEFIRANIPVCNRFIDSITGTEDISLETLDDTNSGIEVPKNAYMNSLVWFHNFLLTKPDFIESFPDLKQLFGKHAQPIF